MEDYSEVRIGNSLKRKQLSRMDDIYIDGGSRKLEEEEQDVVKPKRTVKCKKRSRLRHNGIR